MLRSRLQALGAQFRRKPFSSLLTVIAVMVVVWLLGEFAAGVIDGLIMGFTDAV